jgi:hypothetical protein
VTNTAPPLRFAYADPPYPGQAVRWYAGHKDFGGEVDHAELIAHLATFDGWALSTSSAALQDVLALSPVGVRVGVWYRSNSEHPGNRGRWWWSWEPVIFYGWRKHGETVRDLLAVPKPFASAIPGEKPPEFTRWVMNLLGVQPADTFVDLFPGSNAVAREAAALTLPIFEGAAG